MPECPSTVGGCEVMRTCNRCRRVLATRSACISHQLACTEDLNRVFSRRQHVHWISNHTHENEQARRRARKDTA